MFEPTTGWTGRDQAGDGYGQLNRVLSVDYYVLGRVGRVVRDQRNAQERCKAVGNEINKISEAANRRRSVVREAVGRGGLSWLAP